MAFLIVTSKIIFAFLGSLLFATGVIFMVLGSLIYWGYVENNNIISVMLPYKWDTIASIILIIVGLILLMAAFSAFYNICFNQKGCWWTFFVCLFLIIVLITTAAILGFVYRNKLHNSLEEVMYSAIKNYDSYGYGGDIDMQQLVDTVQTVFHCCGVHNVSDWWYTSYGKIPQSCSAGHSVKWGDETTGCYDRLINTLDKNIKYVIGCTVGVMLVFLLGIFVSCALICYKNVEKKEKEISVSYEKFY